MTTLTIEKSMKQFDKTIFKDETSLLNFLLSRAWDNNKINDLIKARNNAYDSKWFNSVDDFFSDIMK